MLSCFGLNLFYSSHKYSRHIQRLLQLPLSSVWMSFNKIGALQTLQCLASVSKSTSTIPHLRESWPLLTKAATPEKNWSSELTTQPFLHGLVCSVVLWSIQICYPLISHKDSVCIFSMQASWGYMPHTTGISTAIWSTRAVDRLTWLC